MNTQKPNFQRIYNRINREINFITQSSLVNYREELRADAQRITMELKPEIEKWIAGLNKKEISCAELYCLIQQKKDEIEIRGLSDKSVTDNEKVLIKNSLLQLISNTIINSYLNSLFENDNLLDLSAKTNSDFYGT